MSEVKLFQKKKIEELFEKIKDGKINSWREVHSFYDECQENYTDYKARYAVYIIEYLYSKKVVEFSESDFEDFSKDVAFVSINMLESSIAVREKDFTDFFRSLTFRNEGEKKAVLGSLEDDSFLKMLRSSTDEFENSLNKLFSLIR